MIKDILFSAVGYIGVVVIILCLIWGALELLNKLFHIVKYIIMYEQYRKTKEIYKNKNNLIITNKGKVLYSCAGNSLEEKIDILNKAINNCKEMIELRQEYNK